MGLRSYALALFLLLATAPIARADIGFQQFVIPDPDGAPIEVGVWYPTRAAVAVPRAGLSPTVRAVNGPLEGRGLPLVVISHGTGGSFSGHADTAAALAEAGMVAAALAHTGDNWRDRSRALRIWDRPRQLSLLIDYMTRTWPSHTGIDPQRVGAFGFSAGGFTVLAAAGGEPDLTAIEPHCRVHPEAFECGLRASATEPLPDHAAVHHDSRIRAIVVAAPALGYTFGRKGLEGVGIPVQLWRAENDHLLPHPWYAEAVRAGLPTPPEMHLVEGAEHFDFLAPCTDQERRYAPQICTSAHGFDRAAFHLIFNREVVAFFRRTLGK